MARQDRPPISLYGWAGAGHHKTGLAAGVTGRSARRDLSEIPPLEANPIDTTNPSTYLLQLVPTVLNITGSPEEGYDLSSTETDLIVTGYFGSTERLIYTSDPNPPKGYWTFENVLDNFGGTSSTDIILTEQTLNYVPNTNDIPNWGEFYISDDFYNNGNGSIIISSNDADNNTVGTGGTDAGVNSSYLQTFASIVVITSTYNAQQYVWMVRLSNPVFIGQAGFISPLPHTIYDAELISGTIAPDYASSASQWQLDFQYLDPNLQDIIAFPGDQGTRLVSVKSAGEIISAEQIINKIAPDQSAYQKYALATASAYPDICIPNALGADGGSNFGYSIDSRGNLLVVGAPGSGGGVTSPNAFAYVRKLDTGSVITIDSPNAVSSTAFGTAVATNGSLIAVSDQQSREVYLYNSEGTLLHTYTNPNRETTDTNDAFGLEVMFSKDYLFISAPRENGDDNNDRDTGATYMFAISGAYELLDTQYFYSTFDVDNHYGGIELSHAPGTNTILISGSSLASTNPIYNCDGGTFKNIGWIEPVDVLDSTWNFNGNVKPQLISSAWTTNHLLLGVSRKSTYGRVGVFKWADPLAGLFNSWGPGWAIDRDDVTINSSDVISISGFDWTTLFPANSDPTIAMAQINGTTYVGRVFNSSGNLQWQPFPATTFPWSGKFSGSLPTTSTGTNVKIHPITQYNNNEILLNDNTSLYPESGNINNTTYTGFTDVTGQIDFGTGIAVSGDQSEIYISAPREYFYSRYGSVYRFNWNDADGTWSRNGITLALNPDWYTNGYSGVSSEGEMIGGGQSTFGGETLTNDRDDHMPNRLVVNNDRIFIAAPNSDINCEGTRIRGVGRVHSNPRFSYNYWWTKINNSPVVEGRFYIGAWQGNTPNFGLSVSANPMGTYEQTSWNTGAPWTTGVRKDFLETFSGMAIVYPFIQYTSSTRPTSWPIPGGGSSEPYPIPYFVLNLTNPSYARPYSFGYRPYISWSAELLQGYGGATKGYVDGLSTIWQIEFLFEPLDPVV